MTTTKIPNYLLKEFQCSQCNFFLSMGPIGIKTNGQSICGRCINWTAPQSTLIAECKLFQELASIHMFPCSYQSEGCSEYVYFNQATLHESKCPYRTHRCPVSFYSKCDWDGSVSQISQHYRVLHPELYLKSPSFRITYKEDYETYNLVEIDDEIFLLQIKCAIQKKKIWFNTVCFGAIGDESSTKYRITLSGEINRRFMKLEEKTPLPRTRMHLVPSESIEVDINGLLALLEYPEFIECRWDFTISEEVRRNVTKCPNCNLCMVPPIYRCPLGHLTCTDCKGYNEKCGICRETKLELTRAVDLETIAFSAQFYCRWYSCYKKFYCGQIRQHEQECPKRIYECPECHLRIGLFNEIYTHFQTEHPHIPFEVTKTDILKFSTKTHFTYVLVHREIFKVNVNKNALALWTIHITYYGPPGLDSYFKYEIRDLYNVLYYASKCHNNHYRATQLTYCTSDVRCEYYLSIRFNKQLSTNTWIPFHSPVRQTCMTE